MKRLPFVQTINIDTALWRVEKYRDLSVRGCAKRGSTGSGDGGRISIFLSGKR